MYVSKWFRRDKHSKRNSNDLRKHRLRGFEQLEDRSLLAVFGWEVTPQPLTFLDPSQSGLPDGNFGKVPAGTIQTVDRGDHYPYYSDEVKLLRVADEVLVRIADSADPRTVKDSLTSADGLLANFAETQFGQGRLVALKSPDGRDVASRDELFASLTARDDVLWSAPVFVIEGSDERIWFMDQIVVALNSGVKPDEFFANGYDGWKPFFQNQYLATVPGGAMAALERANALSLDPNVAWASPDFYNDIRLATNDTLFNDQWNIENTGQTNAQSDADVDLEGAWGFTPGSSDIVVAVIDNGVQTNHPDLNIFVNTAEQRSRRHGFYRSRLPVRTVRRRRRLLIRQPLRMRSTMRLGPCWM
jgi:hypothetical protein